MIGKGRFSVEELEQIRQLSAQGVRGNKLARMFHTNEATISRIINNVVRGEGKQAGWYENIDFENRRKVCSRCTKWKSFDDFDARKGRPAGLKYECRECASLYQRLRGDGAQRLYGVARERLTEDELLQMMERQHGLCDCCGCVIVMKTCKVDHNHETGKVRGMVCGKCNIVIGHVENGLIPNVTRYLEKYSD